MTLRLILSGGIGSGKSAAATVLAELGAKVIDADRIGHSVLEPGGEAFADVAAAWPEVVVDGRIRRRALGRIVFSDRAELDRLEAITHPAIRRRIATQVAASDAEVVVVELPIPGDLLGPGWTRIVVDAPDALRRLRLRGRGMDQDEIEGRMAAQPSRSDWIALADHVVDNSAGLDALAANLRSLLAQLRRET